MNSGMFNKKRPRYQLVAEELLQGIENGAYAVGDLLPSEAQLCEQHGVSRHTVRSAIRELAERGLLSAQPGVGTRVVSRKMGQYTQIMKEISDLTGYVKETTRQVLDLKVLTADTADIPLPGDPDAQWHMFEAVRQLVDEEVNIAWTQVFVLPQYAETLSDVTENQLVNTLIEKRFGTRTTNLRQAIKAIACPEHAARWLGLEPGDPALSVLREYVSEEDGVYEVSWSIHPPERFESKMELVLTLS